jgi:hypothetical protein
MAMVKEPQQTVYNGKIENLRLHIQDFTRRIQKKGLYQEFTLELRRTQDQRTFQKKSGYRIISFAGKSRIS